MTDNELLMAVASLFKKMTRYRYEIVTGRKGIAEAIEIALTPDGFKHLTGLHKAKSFSEVYTAPSGALLRDVLHGKFDISVLSEEDAYPNIIERLTHLLKLKQYLDEFSALYRWSKDKAHQAGIYTIIDADFMIPCESLENENKKIFLFLIRDKDGTFKITDLITDKINNINLKSQELITTQTIIIDSLDYTRGQLRPPTMLYKARHDIISGSKEVLFDRLTQKA